MLHDSGVIRPKGAGRPDRLADLARRLESLLEAGGVDEAAVETPFSGRNPRSAIVLAEARGVILAVLGAQGLAVGFATVYRSMSLFVEAGIAKERRFHEGCVRYEPGVDVGHHDHLVCEGCGAIEEFEDPTIERIQQEIAVKRGFEVRYHRLELYGRCRRCGPAA